MLRHITELCKRNGRRQTDGAPSRRSSLGGGDPSNRDWLSETLRRPAAPHAEIDDATRGQESEGPQYAAEGDEIPFTVVTWNVWFSPFEWRARLGEALRETLRCDPDVFFFQEVTVEFHDCMLRCAYLRERYEPTEPHNLPHGYDVAIWVKRGGSDGGRSFQRRCSTIPLESIYGRRGLCVDLEISAPSGKREIGEGTRQRRVRVVTSHLESGRGMAATRESQLRELFSSICGAPWDVGKSSAKDRRKNSPNDNIADALILAGDFNLDPTYPENGLVESNGVDAWKALRPDEDGFTEDTRRNEMRYLAHGKHKRVRFDRVLLVSPRGDEAHTGLKARPLGIRLLGVEPFGEGRGLWVSDHFGLVARLGLRDQPLGAEFCPSKKVKQSDEAKTNDGYMTP